MKFRRNKNCENNNFEHVKIIHTEHCKAFKIKSHPVPMTAYISLEAQNSATKFQLFSVYKIFMPGLP